MKPILRIILVLSVGYVLSVGSQAAQFPLKNPLLQSNLDGGGQSITNLSGVTATNGTFDVLLLDGFNLASLTNLIGLDLTQFQPATATLSNVVNTVTVDDEGNITGTNHIQGATLGTTENPDLDAALLSAFESIDSVTDDLESFMTDNQTIAAQWGFNDLHIIKVPTSTVTTNTGTALEYDWTGAAVQLRVVTGNATRAAVNAPTGTNAVWGPVEILISDATTNCSLGQIDGHILFGRKTVGGVVPTEIAPNTTIFYQALYTPAYTWFFWRGNQDAPLSMPLGGSGVITGVAPDGKDVLGSMSFTSVTNVEVDLASGTVFRLPNTTNSYLVAPASRLSASDTNSLVRTRRVEMLPPNAQRVVSFDTNAYALSGISQVNTVAVGQPFVFTLVNWGPESSNNIAYASLSTNVTAAGGGGGASAWNANLGVWLDFQDSSGPATDSHGDYDFYELGGTFSWRAPGPWRTYAATNAADSTLCVNSAAAILTSCTNIPFTALITFGAQTGSATEGYIAGQWDYGNNRRVWGAKFESSTLKVWASTNGTGPSHTLTMGSVSASTTNTLAIIWDPAGDKFKASLNGGSFVEETVTFPYLHPNVPPITVGGAMNSGVAGLSSLGSIQQFVMYTNSVKTLGYIQDFIAAKPQYTP